MDKRKDFKFDDYRVAHVKFDMNQNYDDDSVEIIEIKPKISVSHSTQEDLGFVLLSVIVEGENVPFTIELEMLGQFTFNKDYIENNDLKRVLHINCASMIFPFIREFIADLTRRAGFPPLLLSPVNFVSLFRETEKKELEENK